MQERRYGRELLSRIFVRPFVVVGTISGIINLCTAAIYIIKPKWADALSFWEMLIPLGIFIVACLVSAFFAQRAMYNNVRGERDSLKNSLPNIEVYRTEIHLRSIYHDKIEGPIATPFFGSIHFRNRRNRQAGTTATNVCAEISFFDANDNQVFSPPIYGRWGDTIQPGESPNPNIVRELEMVDIEANQRSRELNVVLKHKEDDCCYAFNNQSYQAIDFRLPSFILSGPEFHVKVELVGENTRTEWWFLLRNQGKGRAMSLDPISQP